MNGINKIIVCGGEGMQKINKQYYEVFSSKTPTGGVDTQGEISLMLSG